MTDPTPLDSGDLDRLRELEQAATPAPWHPATTGVESGDHWSVIDYATMDVVCRIPSQDGSNDAQREPDARFIAAARNALPGLLDALADARARADAAEGKVAAGLALADEWDVLVQAVRQHQSSGWGDRSLSLLTHATALRAALADSGAES